MRLCREQLGWAEAARLRSWKHAVFFGQNLVALQPRGIIKVGQAVEVRATSQLGGPRCGFGCRGRLDSCCSRHRILDVPWGVCLKASARR